MTCGNIRLNAAIYDQILARVQDLNNTAELCDDVQMSAFASGIRMREEEISIDLFQRQPFNPFLPAPIPPSNRFPPELLGEGRDVIQTTVFHVAAEERQFHLLLVLVAEPGCEWKERYFFSQNQLVMAPVKGRACIADLEDFWEFGQGLTWEAVEILLPYGYTLTEQDMEDMTDMAGRDATDECWCALHFCWAMANTCILDRPSLLSSCVGIAIGGNHDCFVGGTQPISLHVAQILLAMGADPNGYCFEDDPDSFDYGVLSEFTPALYQAMENQDMDMIQLLLRYGAKPLPRLVSRNPPKVDTATSIEVTAEELGIAHLLQPEREIILANPEAFREDLRRKFMGPVKALASRDSSAWMVAMMRQPGRSPPIGLLSKTVLHYCYGLPDIQDD